MEALPVTTKKVVIQQFLVAWIWGGSWIVGRVLALQVPAFAIAGWRTIFTILALTLLLLYKHRSFPRVSLRDGITIAMMGFMGIFLYSVCFFYGLKYIQAGRGALVVALNPVAVTLGASLFLGEALTRKKVLGGLLALLGCLTVLGRGHPFAIFNGAMGLGEYLILGCVVCWTSYTLLARRISKTVSSLAITLYSTAAGGVLLILAGWVEGSMRTLPHFSLSIWLNLLYLAILSSGIAYIWYANGIKQLGAARTAAFVNLVPFSAVILGAFILKESINLMTLLGGVCILAGVALTNKK